LKGILTPTIPFCGDLEANENIYGFDNSFFDIPNEEAMPGAWRFQMIQI
jgi:hypothetical protein